MDSPHAPSFQPSNDLDPAHSPDTAQSASDVIAAVIAAVDDGGGTFPPVPHVESVLAPPVSDPRPVSPSSINTYGPASHKYFTPPKPCECPSAGRTLVVCIDGTSNQYGEKNTNVVELYSRLSKNPQEQLTYYSSGIGTYAKPSLRTSTFIGSWRRALGYRLDLVFAWRFERILWGAYQWLSENYEEGDRIFVFGFSRGAYQVRVLSAMIDYVGLIHKGNQDQIPFAFELYNESGKVLEDAELRRATSDSEPWESKAEVKARKLLLQFKKTFSRTVRVHFVGAWDTVSSVGILRGKTFPGTTRGMGHVCYFRHALALHERRVKFQPEFACGGLGPMSTHTHDSKLSPDALETETTGSRLAMPHTKEVWFAGSHSQVGGGSEENTDLNKWGPSLRWIGADATIAGLKFDTDVTEWIAQPSAISHSLTVVWRLLEIMPFKRLRYGQGDAQKVSSPTVFSRPLAALYVRRKRTSGGLDRTTYWPNLGRARSVQPGHLIHETAFQYERQDSWRALLPRRWRWDKAHLDIHGRLEHDDYENAQSLLSKIWRDRTSPQDDDILKLQGIIETGMGRSVLRALVKDTTSAEVVLVYMMNHLFSSFADSSAPTTVPARMCSTVFQALEIVRPHLQMEDCTPSEMSLRQMEDFSEEDSLRCRITRAPSTKGLVRAIAREISKLDSTVARRFMIALGTAEMSRFSRDYDNLEYYHSLAEFPDGLLAVASDEMTIRVCDTKTATMRLYTRTRPVPVHSLAISGDGQLVVAGCSDGAVRVWNSASIADTHGSSLEGHNDWVRSVVISSDDSLLLSCSDDRTLRLWKLGARASTGRPMQHPEYVRCAAFSSARHFIASGCDDGKIRIWDTVSNELVAKLSGHALPVFAIAISDNDKLIASGAHNDSDVHLWRLGLDVRRATLEPALLLKLEGHSFGINGVAFSPDSERLVSCSDDATIRMWDTNTGNFVRLFHGHTRCVRDVKYLRGGKRFASCSEDGTVRIWDATDAWTRYESEEADASVAAQSTIASPAETATPAIELPTPALPTA